MKLRNSKSPKKFPLVSVIIANWNGKNFLIPCLDSLSEISYPNFEIILVDNGSSDGSVEIIKDPNNKINKKLKVKIIQNKKNLGFAQANNQGAKKAQGKYLLLLNNDTEVEKNFLEKLVETMEKDRKIVITQPKIIFSIYKKLQSGGSFLTRSGFLYQYGYFENPDEPKFNKEMKIFSSNGACMLIRKEIVQKIGLFDKDFFSYFEESDFCWRVILAGYEIYYKPISVIYHKGRQTSDRLPSGTTQYLLFRNRLCSLIKNLSAKELTIILPLHIIVSIVLMIVFVIFGKMESALSIPKAFCWNLSNITKTLKKRNFVQKEIRKISDKEILKNYLKKRSLYSYLLVFLLAKTKNG